MFCLPIRILLQLTPVQYYTTIAQKSSFFTKVFLGKTYLRLYRTTVTHKLDSTQKTKQKILSESGQTRAALSYERAHKVGEQAAEGNKLGTGSTKVPGRKLTHLPSTQTATQLKVNSLCHSWWGAKRWPLSHQPAGTACSISFVSLSGTDYY